MSKTFIDYGSLVDNAMHLIVKESLKIFSKLEDVGEHHFFISFVTKYPGVVLSEKLLNRYPLEMTIVLQHMYENLEVDDEKISVSLSFDGKKENIVIPLNSLTAFADPSVKFGLQFRHADEFTSHDGKKINTTVITSTSSSEDRLAIKTKKKEKDNNNVISLDFKNKKLL